MNWFGNGNSAHLWTIGLGILVVLAVGSAIAYYFYSRPRREVGEEHDLALEQRINERLAQIAVPPAPWIPFRKRPYLSALTPEEPEVPVEQPELPEEFARFAG